MFKLLVTKCVYLRLINWIIICISISTVSIQAQSNSDYAKKGQQYQSLSKRKVNGKSDKRVPTSQKTSKKTDVPRNGIIDTPPIKIAMMKYIREATADLHLQKYTCPPGSRIDSILNKYLHDLDNALKDAPRDWLRSETDTVVTFIHFQESPSSTDLVFRCLNGCHDGPIKYNFAGGMEKDGKIFVFTHGVAGHLKLTTDTINIYFRYTEYEQKDDGWRNGWKNGSGYYTKTYR